MTFQDKFFGSNRSLHLLNKVTDFQLEKEKERKTNRKRFMTTRLNKELSLSSVFDAVFMQYQQNRWNLEKEPIFATQHDPFSASSEEKPVEFCRPHTTLQVPKHCGFAAAQPGGDQGHGHTQ